MIRIWLRECIGGTVSPAELEVDPAAVSGVPPTVHAYITLVSDNEQACDLHV